MTKFTDFFEALRWLKQNATADCTILLNGNRAEWHAKGLALWVL